MSSNSFKDSMLADDVMNRLQGIDIRRAVFDQARLRSRGRLPVGMEFAKKQLEKYGWKEGEGLGKAKSGISKAIRPKLKFDTGGLGHDVFEDINNTWWQRLYDEAAKNIVTKKNEDDSVVLETVDDSVEITTKRKKKRKKAEEAVYQNFVKISELNHNVEKKLVEEEEEQDEKKKMTSGICDLTDEELFRICGGRTAHKGARHGLKMNAKLSRIEKQENSLNTDNSEGEPVVKKPKISHKSKRRKKNDGL